MTGFLDITAVTKRAEATTTGAGASLGVGGKVHRDNEEQDKLVGHLNHMSNTKQNPQWKTKQNFKLDCIL